MTGTLAPAPQLGRREGQAWALASLRHALAALDHGMQVVHHRQEHERARGIDPALRGLVITETEFGELLRSGGAVTDPLPCLAGQLWHAAIAQSASEDAATLPIQRIREAFGLTTFECEVLLLCVAPEMDVRYARLFGYLNDDVTRRWASVQTLLALLAPPDADPLAWRTYLMPEGALLRRGLLSLVDDARGVSGVAHLGRCVRVEPGLVRFLLGEDALDAEVEAVRAEESWPVHAAQAWDGCSYAPLVEDAIAWGLGAMGGDTPARVVVLEGPQGAGRRALTRRVCTRHGAPPLMLDGELIMRHHAPSALWLRLMRDAAVHGCPLYIANADALASDRERSPILRTHLVQGLQDAGGLLVLASNETRLWHGWFSPPAVARRDVMARTFSYADRAGAWTRLIAAARGQSRPWDLEVGDSLGARFRLSPGEMAVAIDRADTAAHQDADSLERRLRHEAAQVAASDLGTLADRIEPIISWPALVLPRAQRELLWHVVHQVRTRRTVMEEWQFVPDLARGRGVTVLLFGPPGTGKTMSAEVLAGELGMALYRIDLSSVVSKYIGETEKNLARVFRAAEGGDVVLFFDEADALFGKRSEVRDAHDRYANIEIDYLLQQMEQFSGVAILATNQRSNIDDAFLRRIHVAVECPMPSPADREEIWERTLPAQAPRDPDLDLAFLARTFEVSGGVIRNVCLAAAVMAATEGTGLGMRHLVCALQRELHKGGKRAVREDFGRYFPLIESLSLLPAA